MNQTVYALSDLNSLNYDDWIPFLIYLFRMIVYLALVCDIIHVYKVVSKRKALDLKSSSFEYLKYYKKNKDYILSNEEFQLRTQKALELWRYEKTNQTVPFNNYMKVMRESALFLGGGRAAILQIAHPFVAIGIVQHSNLEKHGTRKRFHNTFKHMWAMSFGDSPTALRSARVVRRLHNRVVGVVDSTVGIFDKGETFSANNEHALLWVHMTLVDTSILMYETIVGLLETKEKDDFVRVGGIFLQSMFGVSPDLIPTDYEDFQQKMVDVTASDLIQVGDQAKYVNLYLWKAPKIFYKPILSYVEYLSFVILPDKLGEQFYGRKPSKTDIFLASIALGILKFIYSRILPLPMRFITSYLNMIERTGVKNNYLQKTLASISKNVANFLVSCIMPMKKA